MKYGPVLDICNSFNMKDAKVEEKEEGYLKIYGVVHTQYEKNKIWDKIKEIGCSSASDIKADIRTETGDYYHIHRVENGDTLGKFLKNILVKQESIWKYLTLIKINYLILT